MNAENSFAFAEYGLTPEDHWIKELKKFNTYEDIEQVIREAFAAEPKCAEASEASTEPGAPFDAIFAFNDVMAWMIIAILRSMGYRVPEQVEVVGFDNVQSRFTMPFPMCSVHTPKADLIRECCETLYMLIEDLPQHGYEKGRVKVHKVIETKLSLSTDNVRNYLN